MTRPTWDEYFMDIAKVVATRSEDSKTKVGAVLVKDNRIVSTGYNGGPAGFDGVDWDSDVKHVHVLHAELNALIYAGLDKSMGVTLYVTYSPCGECAKAIAAAKVKRVVYGTPYKNGLGIDILKEFGIETEELK